MPVSPLRRRLLDSARAELGEAGTARVSLRSIARRVGVSHQATHHYFSDRADLLTAVAIEGLGELTGTCDEVVASGGTAEEVVAKLGAAYVAYADSHPALFELMFGSGAGLIDPRSPELQTARSEVWKRLQEAIGRAVTEEWDAQDSAEVLAMTAWATVHGLATLRRDGVTIGTLGLEPAELIRQALRTIRR